MNAPTSTALKILRGNEGKRPLARKPPVLPTEAPDCPEDLSLDPVALETWHYYEPILLRSGNLTKADRNVLKSLCYVTSYLEQARKTFREGGEIEYETIKGRKKKRTVAEPRALVVSGPRGAAVTDPYLAIIHNLLR